MAIPDRANIFISSTCYDLVDLRAEVTQHLRTAGFNVKLSEDPNSAWNVEPDVNSIDTCLENVRSSDAVVCIIDRRYGAPLDSHNGRSATHAEVEVARDISKPVFFFVREIAFQEYGFMRRNSNPNTAWVEPGQTGRRESWKAFMDEVSGLPMHANWSNWCDLYKSSVDLKDLILRRLVDYFPAQSFTLALSPERVVRLTFEFETSHADGALRGHFKNVGLGPALNLRHGVRVFNKFTEVAKTGALGVGEMLLVRGSGQMYHSPASLLRFSPSLHPH